MRSAPAALLLTAALAYPSVAAAQALTLGPPLAEQAALPREDGDRARPEAYREIVFDDRTPFPYGLNLFGDTHDRLYINLDGTIGLGPNGWMALGERTADPFLAAEADQPLIAPFSARVADAASAACDAHPHTHRIFLETDRDWLLVTWNAMLRPGDRCDTGAPTNTVQLVLLPDVPNEDTLEACNRPPRAPDPCFTIEYRYPSLGWAEYCVDPALGCDDRRRAWARVGIDAAGHDFELAVPRSGSPAMKHLAARSNIGESGVWRIHVIGGALLPDRDADAVEDTRDNCPDTANSDQGNLDGNRWGNACDIDSDGDGALNCAFGECPPDTDGIDNDLDGLVDELIECMYEPCDPRADYADNDRDGRVDEAGEQFVPRHRGVDNCPLIPNPTQADRDADRLGDACDPDRDGNGTLDWIDALRAESDRWRRWLASMIPGTVGR